MSESHPNRRRSRTALLIGLPLLVVLLLAVIIGPRIYAASENSNAEAAPAVSLASPTVAPDAATGTPASVEALSGRWTAQQGSYAGYRVDEVLNGADVTVTGRTEQVTAEVQVDRTQLTSARITVDMASISTDSSRRDNYFRSTALQTDRFPQATFASTTPVDVAAMTSGGTSRVQVPGELTIHGVTRPVTLELQAAHADGRVQVAGTAPITFADFGVTPPDLGFVKVEPTGQIEFSLQLARG
ncbi:polyisoprenoid-binding protein YceI [Propionibacteriaceae bacterium ES.041]|uniref:YceI family protein n=1 Tax=Enemella evansiae TaxID=2016499 RepID=UPI000B963F2D|nr:YceI family protein [Enemella evansiae]OYO00322.1 polyisoprenoid-binding protein [Enemella evansiae]PFG68376.1 polyisoprenoid-binding protein YceI [Propionibacteriaceae bacterium ES.041]